MIDREAMHVGPEQSGPTWIASQSGPHNVDAAGSQQDKIIANWSAPIEKARPGGDSYLAFYVCASVATGDVGNSQFVPAGSVVVVDADGSAFLPPGTLDTRDCIAIRHRHLDRYIARGDWGSECLTLRADDPVGALVSNYARGLAGHQQEFTRQQLHTIVDGLCRLIALAATRARPGHDPAEDRRSVKMARLARLKRHIHARITDPGLSATTLAQAVGMSSRNVHLLFEHSGETFAEHVTSERLKACRTALTDPAQSQRSVTDIAFGSGFANLTTFYRAFRAAFGVTPLQMRARASLASTEISTPHPAPYASDRAASGSQFIF